MYLQSLITYSRLYDKGYREVFINCNFYMPCRRCYTVHSVENRPKEMFREVKSLVLPLYIANCGNEDINTITIEQFFRQINVFTKEVTKGLISRNF